MINGSAMALAVIAIILLILLLSRRCGSDNADTAPPVISTDVSTVAASDSLNVMKQSGRSSKSKTRSRKSTERQPKVYPERSPLDEPVANK